MKKILLSLSLILLGYASFSQQDIKSRWIVNINGFRFTLHNAGDSIFKVKTDSVLFGKPTNLPFVSQSTLNDSAASIRSAITDSTVYTSYPLQSAVVGATIEQSISQGFLDSVRNGGIEYTYTIDLTSADYEMEGPGVYRVTHGSTSFDTHFPDPTLFDGQWITIINNDTDLNDPADFHTHRPKKNGSNVDWDTCLFGEMMRFVSIGGLWRGGKFTE